MSNARIIITVTMSYDGEDVDEYNQVMDDLRDGCEKTARDIDEVCPGATFLSVEATG